MHDRPEGWRGEGAARWRPVAGAPARGRDGHVFAALDLGTNNCRLLIVRPQGEGFRVVDSFSRIVRLGEGVAATGALSEAAIDRAVAALHICAGKMARRGVTRLRCVATEACRQATNGAAFLARVKAETGIELEIITAGEEARYALAGCAPLLDRRYRNALVFDIGGGSTEIMWIEVDGGGYRLLGWISVPAGVVTMAERWAHEADRAVAWEGMIDEVRQRLLPFDGAWQIGRAAVGGGVQMLGTSGTVTTVASVLMDLPRYDRHAVDGCWIDLAAVGRLSQRLSEQTSEERAQHPCIGPGRADLVVPGCAILEAMRRTWPAPRLRVADRGVREGILMSLMQDADAP